MKVGLGGDENFKQHEASRKHKDHLAAASATSKLKATQLTNFFGPKQPSTKVPAASSKSTNSLSTTASVPSTETIIDVESVTPTHDRPTQMAPSQGLIHRLCTLVASLPSSIPVACPSDVLARFAQDPRNEIEEGEDPYEAVIDRALSNAIGYEKQAVDVAEIIRRGALGMDGFCEWVKICVFDLNVPVSLLELRLERICEAMKIV